MLEKALSDMNGYQCVQEIQYYGNFVDEKDDKKSEKKKPMVRAASAKPKPSIARNTSGSASVNVLKKPKAFTKK
jgi:hypothetical protein